MFRDILGHNPFGDEGKFNQLALWRSKVTTVTRPGAAAYSVA